MPTKPESFTLDYSRRLLMDSSTILAKLLASENLDVIHDPSAKTASFNMKDRVITLPIYKECGQSLYVTFDAHEVAHALWTPFDKWTGAINQIATTGTDAEKNVVSMYLNIVEDARIERLILRKFPGFRTDFAAGYKELVDKGFLGEKVNSNNIFSQESQLPLIDRLNILAKVRHITPPNTFLSSKEQIYYDAIMTTETFEDVVRVTKELYEYVLSENRGKAIEKAKLKIKISKGNKGGKSVLLPKGVKLPNGINAPTRTVGAGESSSEKKSSTSSHDSELNDKNEDMLDLSNMDPDDIEIEESDLDPEDLKADESETQKSLEEALKNLTLGEKTEIKYTSVSSNGDPEEYIIPYNSVLSYIRSSMNITLNEEYFSTLYTNFHNSQKPQINYFVNEFQMKMAADASQRTQISKTGVLDPNKLHGFKINDDLFRRSQITRSGKNHGFMVVMDWSGSMSSQLKETIEQFVTVAFFCRQNSVPFRMYLFSDSSYDLVNYNNDLKKTVSSRKNNLKKNKKYNFSLIEVFNEKMSGLDFKRMVSFLLHFANVHDHESKIPVPTNCSSLSSSFSMGGTPLDPSIVSSFSILKKFRTETNVQVLNYIILTDGDNTCNITNIPDNGVVVLRDDHTKYQLAINLKDEENHTSSITSGYLELLSKVCDVNTVGIYVYSDGSTSSFSSFRSAMVSKNCRLSEKDLQVQFNRGYGEIVHAGFDKYFVVPKSSMTISKSFAKNVDDLAKLRKQKVILSQIVSMIVEKKVRRKS